jgi:hypothetical protein
MSEEKMLSVSWSRLKTWEHCKQKAWLQSGGFKSPTANTRVFFRGTVTDRILRTWLQDENRQSEQMPSMVEEYIELCEQEHKDQGTGIVRWKSPTDKQESVEWCKDLLTNIEPIVQELVVPYLPDVYADKHLKAKITIPDREGNPKEILMIGILDILIDSPEFLAVYDLKATADESYWKKTIMQLVFYTIMLEASGYKSPDATALIQPMCKEQIKYIDITDQHRMALMQKIVAYAHSVWAADFSPKESDAGCLNWCEMAHACVKFKKNESGRLNWV